MIKGRDRKLMIKEENRAFYPVDPGAEEKIRRICEERLKEEYGNAVPAEAVKRLEQEFPWLREEKMAATVLLVRDAFEKLGIPESRRTFVGCQLLLFYLCGLTEVDPLKMDRRFFPKMQRRRTTLEFRLPKGYAEKLAKMLSEAEGVRAELTEMDGYYMISLIPEKYEKHWKGFSYDNGFMRFPVVEWEELKREDAKSSESGSNVLASEAKVIEFLIREAGKWPGEGKKAFCLPILGNENFRQVLQVAREEIRSFSDLVRAYAFAHSNVPWWDEAMGKLQKGEISFRELLCCREDVMELLLGKGVALSEAIDLTWHIYFGKVLSAGQKETIRSLGLSNQQEKMILGMEQGYLWGMESVYDLLLKQVARAVFFSLE